MNTTDFRRPESDRHEQFLRLLSHTENKVRRYIATLVPNRNDVDDVFQETLIALWRRFDDYRPEQSFDAWAFRFAHYQVLSYRKKKAVQSKHFAFSDNAVELLAADQIQRSDFLASQRTALSKCLERLTEEDRELLELRYSTDVPICQVARDTDQPARTLYQALERVRRQLLHCVSLRLGGGVPS
jgi:RNA polymerase sigma-70 factor (ECF subfamily)